MSIKITAVNKFYGKQKALNNISFNIKKGEIVGFLGPNGAGKSTLMRIICGYLKQDSGSIEVCNINNDRLLMNSKIGYLAENNPLYNNMYVNEYLLFIGGFYKIPNLKNRVKEVIKKTGLDIEENKKIIQLSKGFKQRVGLAAALIHDPEILILDEPTTGLDPSQLIEIRKLIKNIGRDKTIILSTHIMQEVEKICNRIIIINNGCIIDDQPIKSLKEEQIDLENYFIKATS